MKFLPDQNFPRSCAPLLQEFGHTLCDCQFDPKTGLDDDWLFQEAQKAGAVFLTTDKDFFHSVPWRYARHEGVIVVNLAKPNRIQILEKLRWALDFLTSNPIQNHVLLLRDQRVLYSQRSLDE